jgi:hypothetical protein
MALTDNLVSVFELEEASGSRADAVIATGNTLTDNNTVTQNAGKVGNAAQFTSANSESLSHTDNTSLSTGDIQFTFATWVNFDTAPPAAQAVAVFSKWEGVGNNREYALDWAQASNRFRWIVDSTGTGATVLSADNFGAPSTATWYFIVVTHDSVANTITIRVNNGTADSSAYSAGVFDGAANFNIGRFATGGGGEEFLDGKVDQLCFWKRILTAAEMTQMYNGGAGLSYAGMIGRGQLIGGKRNHLLVMP